MKLFEEESFNLHRKAFSKLDITLFGESINCEMMYKGYLFAESVLLQMMHHSMKYCPVESICNASAVKRSALWGSKTFPSCHRSFLNALTCTKGTVLIIERTPHSSCVLFRVII